MSDVVLPEIVGQHAIEGAFLWLLRSHYALQPNINLLQLCSLDERVDAHIDGLRTAGETAWVIAKEQLLEHGGLGEAFAASVLAFGSGEEDRIEAVLRVGATNPEGGRGLISALGWLPYEKASKHIKLLLAATAPVSKCVGIAAASLHRRNPGPPLLEALTSDDPQLRTQTLRAVGELGLVDAHITLRATLQAKAPAVRFWAAWSNALLNGHKDAVAYLQKVAEDGGPFAERAAQMAMRRLTPNEAKVWLKRLVKELGQKRIAIIAAGAFADPEVIPFLIDQMKVPGLARVAGESFSLITGVHIAYDKLEGTKPEGFEAGPTENPDDENIALDRDENLTWPNPALIQKWWNQRQGQFAKGTRYLLGQPITPESLRLALKNGYQRQRAAAALELAILEPGRPLFEVRAPGFRQRTLLG